MSVDDIVIATFYREIELPMSSGKEILDYVKTIGDKSNMSDCYVENKSGVSYIQFDITFKKWNQLGDGAAIRQKIQNGLIYYANIDEKQWEIVYKSAKHIVKRTPKPRWPYK